MTNSLPWKDPPFLIGKPSINGPLSMAMLNNQRVIESTIWGHSHGKWWDFMAYITSHGGGFSYTVCLRIRPMSREGGRGQHDSYFFCSERVPGIVDWTVIILCYHSSSSFLFTNVQPYQKKRVGTTTRRQPTLEISNIAMFHAAPQLPTPMGAVWRFRRRMKAIACNVSWTSRNQCCGWCV